LIEGRKIDRGGKERATVTIICMEVAIANVLSKVFLLYP